MESSSGLWRMTAERGLPEETSLTRRPSTLPRVSRLATYVTAWRDGVDRVMDLLADLSPEELSKQTDCPEWSVLDVLAHLAAIESDLAQAEPVAAGGSTGEMTSALTERGVRDRAGRSREELLHELRTAVSARAAQLSDLPADPQHLASTGSMGLSWTWERLLRNRVVDVWVHEQDIRRAVGRPGGMQAPGAHVSTHTFAAALPYVVGKKVGAVPGTTVALEVTGPAAATVAVRVDESGRARLTDLAAVDVRLVLDTETFTLLAAGRRRADDVDVRVEGDADLGRRVLDQLAVTP